ncbi:hypothetical protein AK36_6134 (plasmid) [Burkholderia vietnamiensis LMG 10929]|nr:hypothetical protein AK36_6134 [Burkholderia vietnamiensis LMG 10929]
MFSVLLVTLCIVRHGFFLHLVQQKLKPSFEGLEPCQTCNHRLTLMQFQLDAKKLRRAFLHPLCRTLHRCH